MTVYIFTNNAESTLSTAIGTADITLALATSGGVKFPNPGSGEGFHICAVEGSTFEWMICTARSSDSLTVTRDASPSAFSAGASVQHRLHKDALNSFLQKGAERTVSSDPNGSAPVYGGEEVLDSVSGIWWKHAISTTWVAMNSV